jgi:hypothetical protein
VTIARDAATLLPKARRRRDGRSPHAADGKTDPQLRAAVVEMAADMEMGYYIASDGTQWPPKPFIIGELLERAGYSRSNADRSGVRPAWWPGSDALRRLVSFKVLIRQAQRTPSTDTEAPWIDAALASASEELLRRLIVDPAGMASRELVDLTTKLVRMREERRKDVPAVPKGTPAGSRVFQRITETILELPEEEQGRARADMERAIESARAALPAQATVVA